MAAGNGEELDRVGVPYGPPLPPKRSRGKKRLWGDGYVLRGAVGERRYVAVEEVIDDNVGIVIAPWPEVDRNGWLQFGDEEERRQVVVDRASFQRRLANRQVIAYDIGSKERPAMRTRPIAGGDVFAIETRLPESGEGDLREVGAGWIRGTIVDITAMARDAAKAAMLAALTGAPLSPAEAAEIATAAPEGPEPPTPGGRR